MEHKALDQIQPRDLPMPRQAAIALIQACSRDDIAADELATLAQQDPALAAELLRVVNTPLFGFGREISSVARAVTILGHRALQNLALCLAVRDTLRPEVVPGLDPTRHWEDALRRASSARLLAQRVRLDGDTCFTLGLLQDCGLLVLFMRWPEKAVELPQFLASDPDTRFELEFGHFGTTHDQVAARLAEIWGLPDEISHALGQHHRCALAKEPDPEDQRCAVLYCADWLAAVYTVEDKSHAINTCRELLHARFGLSREEIDEILTAIPEAVGEAAGALRVAVNPQQDFQAILREANLRLSEENLSYQELTWRLENALRERDTLAAELNREIEMAREIQRSLLPPPLEQAVQVAGVNVPARDLSGDFYDFFTLADGTILFNLGDVSGKGMNAALLMTKTTSLFRCLGKRVADPAGLLAQINDEICETTIRGMFVSMIAGCYRPAEGRILLANAGHPPALLFRDGRLAEAFGADAPPLGVVAGTTYPTREIALDGGALYLSTDGITESRRPDGTTLGVDGLVAMIATAADRPPRDRLEWIVGSLRADPQALHDDMTLLVVGATTTTPLFRDEIAADAARLSRLRRHLEAVLCQAGEPRERARETVVAVNEACMNIIQHGYGSGGGTITIEVTATPERLCFLLTDTAPPVVAERLKPRDVSEVRPGGLGLCFIHAIMDTVRYLPAANGNRLELCRSRSSAGE